MEPNTNYKTCIKLKSRGLQIRKFNFCTRYFYREIKELIFEHRSYNDDKTTKIDDKNNQIP